MAINKILAHKREEVERHKKEVPEAFLKTHVTPTGRSLRDALSRKRPGFILECKRASPSNGMIRENWDLDAIAQSYKPFASAISVLADEHFFKGHRKYVTQVRNQVDCPVLFKDFVFDPYQVYEARYYGADAILLMLSVVDDETYRACANVCKLLSMDILTEIHTKEELDRAIRLESQIIGINSRSFKDLSVSLDVISELAPLVPKGRLIVAASGIQNHQDVLRLAPKVDAFLVGGSLMAAPDLDEAVRELIFGRVKVCGLTNKNDARVAYDSGAIFGGLNFVEGYPRVVTVEQARVVRENAPLKYVGVFFELPPKQIAQIAKELRLSAVQIHRDVADEYWSELRNLLPASCEIWQASTVGANLSNHVDKWHMDSLDARGQGGTGQVFDWTLVPNDKKSRIILAGGIGPDNVCQASKIGAWALDVNSKVETSPGKKDPILVKQFFEKLRSCEG